MVAHGPYKQQCVIAGMHVNETNIDEESKGQTRE